MPDCNRARIRFLTLHVNKTGDQMGTTSEWNIRLHAGGQSTELRYEGLYSGSVETINRDLIVDMSSAGNELLVFMNGKETDQWPFPDDDLPTAEHTITPIDNWENGQRFTLRPPTNVRDYDYSVDVNIACIDGQALALPDDGPTTRTQTNWRWCRKCQGLWYGGEPHEWTSRMIRSQCPHDGAPHTFRGSGNYAIIIATTGVGGRQEGWRWCRKCQGLFYGRNHPEDTGVCPRGGAHNSTRSGLYSLIHNTPNHPGQQNWRFCHKCEGLFYARHNEGVCPAGGGHDDSRSGAYTLIHARDINW